VNTAIADLLAISAEEVLEAMFFTQVIRRRPILDDGVAENEKAHMAVRLSFQRGPRSSQPEGHLDLEVSRDGSQWIASSFLAADDGSVPQHSVADVICELTNVVCGNVMSNIASESGFSMLSPELIRASGPQWPDAELYEESFELERGWLTLRLCLAGEP
jgi:CheY-specific phosphatase CheX